MNHPHPVIMFDLDGTLFDTAKAIVRAFSATFEALNLPSQSSQDICNTIGLPLEKAFALLLKRDTTDPITTQCVEEYLHQFRSRILPDAKALLFPGVEQGLRELKQHHFNLAVTTNKFARSANPLLAAAGIAEFFGIIVCADEVKEKKPAPESGQKILSFFNLEKHQALMVGDTTHDINMANNLGCKAIAVNYGIHSEEELRSANPEWMASNFFTVVDICHQHFH